MSFLRVRNYQQKCGDTECNSLEAAHVAAYHRPYPEYLMNLEQIVDFRFASEASDGAPALGTVAVGMSTGNWTRLDLESTIKFKKAFEAKIIREFYEVNPELWETEPVKEEQPT